MHRNASNFLEITDALGVIHPLTGKLSINMFPSMFYNIPLFLTHITTTETLPGNLVIVHFLAVTTDRSNFFLNTGNTMPLSATTTRKPTKLNLKRKSHLGIFPPKSAFRLLRICVISCRLLVIRRCKIAKLLLTKPKAPTRCSKIRDPWANHVRNCFRFCLQR